MKFLGRVVAATALIGMLCVLQPSEPVRGQEAIVRKPPDGAIVVDKLVVGDSGLVADIEINVRCEQVPDFGSGQITTTSTDEGSGGGVLPPTGGSPAWLGIVALLLAASGAVALIARRAPRT